MRNRKYLYSGLRVIATFILIVFLVSCEDEDDINNLSNKIEFKDFITSDVSFKTAQVSSKIPDNYGVEITQFGHCWSLESNPDINDSISVFQEYSTNTFVSELNGLKHNSTYYIRVYFKFGDIISYSEEITFKTLEIKLPTLTTKEISKLRAKTVESGGEVESNNGGEVLARGVCWSKSNNPTISDSVTVDSLGIGVFESSIKNLELDTKYYIRAYATNEVGTVFGNEISFTTKDGIPEISTLEITNLTAIAAESGISTTNDGGLDILEKGICYNKSGSPILKDSIFYGGLGVDSYHAVLEDLSVNTTYYIRSFAINEIDTTYGNELIFTTKDGIPEISTLEITNLTVVGAKSGINISNDGGLDIIEKGVCYNMRGFPTIKDNVIYGGSGIGNYDATLENLDINTTYYIRSFAINELDTTYGNEFIFTTKDGILDVSTFDISDIRSTTAKCGGEVLDDEGLSITERGICWNQSGSPTISEQIIIDGDGIGSFESNIENLDISTNYYVRAYAKNEIGVSYGDEVSFTTHDGTPIIYKSIKKINPANAIINIQIIDDYSSITEAGILWGNSSPVTDTDNKIIAGSSVGDYDVDITGLQHGQKYFIKGYAENSIGKTYTEEFEFTTTEYIDGIEFAFVEGGTFIMGDNNGETNEKPEHNVTLSSYKISSYEITNIQYCDFLNSINVGSDGTLDGLIYLASSGTYIEYVDNNFISTESFEQYPATGMSWDAAKIYCEWLGGRLPTEAEWEYAAKGGIYNGDNYVYSGSNNIDDVGWYDSNSDGWPTKVGLKSPNQLGIYDMTGNVWEWCFDWLDLYDGEDQVNPIGPSNIYNGIKVDRGGSAFYSNPVDVEYRDGRSPVGSPKDIGIRVVIPE